MRVRLIILGVMGGLSLLALVLVHVHWLVAGPKDPRFVRFMRRYSHRANADEVVPPHGVAVDARGTTLDVAEPGSTFQHVIDDLALVGGGVLSALSPASLPRFAAERSSGCLFE